MREKKPERRSSTCHSCQTLLITAELCPAGWQAAFGAFHLTEVMGDEGSSSSHLKSVTIHPAVLLTSDTAGQHGPLGECASAAAKRQMAKQILNKGQLILHVSLSIRTPAVVVFVLLIINNRLCLGLKSLRIHVKIDFLLLFMLLLCSQVVWKSNVCIGAGVHVRVHVHVCFTVPLCK